MTALSEPIKPGLQSWLLLLGRDAESTWLEYLASCAVPVIEHIETQADE